MNTSSHITTAEQLLETSGMGRCELVRGELTVIPPDGYEHGRIVSRLSAPLSVFVEANALGVVLAAGTGFLLGRNPDTVRAADIAFIRAERVPGEPLRGFFEGAPDLAVEVISPHDRASDVLAKIRDWLGAGAQVVWVVDPASRTVSLYWLANRAEILTIDDDLRGVEVVPGFKLPLCDLFARPQA
jgi:Uma2 family endonuclease